LEILDVTPSPRPKFALAGPQIGLAATPYSASRTSSSVPVARRGEGLLTVTKFPAHRLRRRLEILDVNKIRPEGCESRKSCSIRAETGMMKDRSPRRGEWSETSGQCQLAKDRLMSIRHKGGKTVGVGPHSGLNADRA
jgi:hypothetical protein